MKKLLPVILAIAMIAALTACGGSDPETKPADPTAPTQQASDKTDTNTVAVGAIVIARDDVPADVIYSFVSIVGATMNLGLLWDIAETFNGMMAIPNLIALLLLSGVVVKLVKEKVDK